MPNKLKIALFIAFLTSENFFVQELIEKIFAVDETTFSQVALEVFSYQYENAEVYRSYCDLLKRNPSNVKSVYEIPFLPIEIFKTHQVISKQKAAEKIFESSGTTGQVTSKHFVADLILYEKSFTKCFELFYGNPNEFVILALLPSYLERENSSLVYMAKNLIEQNNQSLSGFFLNEYDKLFDALNELKRIKQKTILLGVTFALLDFSELHPINFPELIVMETGGMKGRREELTREEVHAQLKSTFGVKQIHSEYGMTELLSQAYSSGEGIFKTPPWMKIFVRDVYDPLVLQPQNPTGGVNVVDLANLYSCSFIATGDLGKIKPDGSFEILGRIDSAEIRGCNLMVM